MFDIASLQYNSENPALIAIVFTVLCSLVLGVLIAFTYEKTSKTVDRSDHFLQAMVLITIVAATIMQAIGDSVARGLGMLGALSIIRFRTTVRNPRNIVFMFGAIAAGIACGVFGFVIAIVGTIGFCITAFLLNFSAFSQKKSLIGTLKLEIHKDFDAFNELEMLLNQSCEYFTLENLREFRLEKNEDVLLYEYRLKPHLNYKSGHLVESLNKLPDVKVLSLIFQNNPGTNI